MEQKANEHVFGGGRMLMGRSVSSQRLACVGGVFLARGEEMRGVPSLEEVSSGSLCMLSSLPWEARW